MNMYAASSVAIALAVTLFDVSSAEAAQVARRAPARTVYRAPAVRNVAPRRTMQSTRQRHVDPSKHATPGTGTTPHTKRSSNPDNGKVSHVPTGSTGSLRGKLPYYKPVANTSTLRGRITVPGNLQPKYTFSKSPYGGVKGRLTPFVQRHWRRAFYWVAIAGLGYLTVPEEYYDRFFAYVDGDDPNYDGAVGLLSLAAVRDEEGDRVRHPMPAGAAYRYRAPVGPANIASTRANLPVLRAMAGDATHLGRIGVPDNLRPRATLLRLPRASLVGRLGAFVQRPWRGNFFWVSIVGVGYLTVPEESYDRFLQSVSGQDPDYEAVVAQLSVAAVRDAEEGRERSPMPSSASYRYQATAVPSDQPPRGEACSLESFVERKWNRAFVWILIPQTGNVTVPEDLYDRFYAQVSASPPDYQGACTLLVGAAAADTIAIASSAN